MTRSGLRALPFAVALLFGGTTAAIACSCIMAPSPAEAGFLARSTLQGAVAIVEADVLTSYDERTRTGERLRVRRLLWGRAPSTLTLARSGSPSSASCDLEFGAGERRVIILYRRPAGIEPHNLCSDYLARGAYLPVLLREARRLRR